MMRFFFQAEDGIRDYKVTGVQTCALPISPRPASRPGSGYGASAGACRRPRRSGHGPRRANQPACPWRANWMASGTARDRKSTRLNSSHLVISYAVFCLKKKKKRDDHTDLWHDHIE